MPQPLSPPRAVAIVIHYSILGGALAFGTVVWFLTSQNGGLATAPVPMLDWVAIGLAAIMLPAALVSRALLTRRAAVATGAARTSLCFQAGLVPVALLEGAILLQLVVWLLHGNPLPNAAIAGFLFVVAATLLPPSPDDLG